MQMVLRIELIDPVLGWIRYSLDSCSALKMYKCGGGIVWKP